VIIEQQVREFLAHMPDDVVSQHAQEHLRTDPPGQAVMDGSDFQVDRFERAESALDVGEARVGLDSN
jgi:hypothetical protein